MKRTNGLKNKQKTKIENCHILKRYSDIQKKYVWNQENEGYFGWTTWRIQKDGRFQGTESEFQFHICQLWDMFCGSHKTEKALEKLGTEEGANTEVLKAIN